MIRLILIALVVALTVLCGSSIALYQYFGWKGLIALPFIIIAMVWTGKKIIGMAIRKFAMGFMGMKSGVLKGATVNVHSVRPVPKPVDEKVVPTDEEQASMDGLDALESASERMAVEQAEAEDPKHYYEVDMTILPHESVDAEAVWEPTEFILTTAPVKNLTDMEDKDVGSVHRVMVWDGNAFGPDDPGKYPGQQRLLATFAVKPGTRGAWLQYYNETLGQVTFPEWKVEAVGI